MKCIFGLKSLFEEPVQKLRTALSNIDQCNVHGHYSKPLNTCEANEMPYHELLGHPLPCTHANAECQSFLRILRAASTHFPVLRSFVCLVYEARKLHTFLESVDTALCSGNFEKLSNLCNISNYGVLLSTKSNNTTGTAEPADDMKHSIRLQQPNLPNLEAILYIDNAELINETENKLNNDFYLPLLLL